MGFHLVFPIIITLLLRSGNQFKRFQWQRISIPIIQLGDWLKKKKKAQNQGGTMNPMEPTVRQT